MNKGLNRVEAIETNDNEKNLSYSVKTKEEK